jgi:hypothetical protein
MSSVSESTTTEEQAAATGAAATERRPLRQRLRWNLRPSRCLSYSFPASAPRQRDAVAPLALSSTRAVVPSRSPSSSVPKYSTCFSMGNSVHGLFLAKVQHAQGSKKILAQMTRCDCFKYLKTFNPIANLQKLASHV